MQFGMIGVGRMGANMVRRLMRAGHDCVGYDMNADAGRALAGEGATGARALEALVARPRAPGAHGQRVGWLMARAHVGDQVMAAYAEGFNILRHADVGQRRHEIDAETTPLRDPQCYQYTLKLADIAEVWRRGSVIASWLLDLTARALLGSPDLATYSGRVSD